MFEFLFAPENVPFMVALGTMVAIGVLEGVTAMMGVGVSEFIDALLPETDLDVDSDMNVSADAGVEGLDLGQTDAHGPLMRVLGWLQIGRVPVLILLVIFLFGFGCAGLVVQSFSAATLGGMLPGWLASLPALVIGVGVVHFLGGLLARVIPRDETEAVSERRFVGRVAVITTGRAWQGHPAEARLRDRWGRRHYVMVEPDVAEAVFEQGDHVLLVGREGTRFRAIDNPSERLVD